MAITITDDAYREFQRLKLEDKLRNCGNIDAFTIKSVCSFCGRQSYDIQPDKGILCEGSWCEGEMVGL